jgi:alpha-glucosidase (family GH31 glycosyl hydrolase)
MGNTTEQWNYWWTDQTYAGDQTVTVSAPLKHVPLFYQGTRANVINGRTFG